MQGSLPSIPLPESIPAPSWIFHVLEIGLFFIHILLMNVLLGISLAALAGRITRNKGGLEGAVGTAYPKLPIFFALTVTIGVAPLLFIQVLYGQFFYASSVLMGRYWIFIIPLIILAYYGVYIRLRSSKPQGLIPTLALLVIAFILLYIAFMLVSNVLLMSTPQSWGSYFSNRKGTILPLGNPSLYPRFLHFVTAAIAIGGLAMAFLPWGKSSVKARNPAMAGIGLRLFAWASCVEACVGIWFLLSLPKGFAGAFLGGRTWATLVFGAAVLAGTAAVVLAFLGRRRPTAILALVAVFGMVLVRDVLRSLYLDPQFRITSLTVAPQYDVLALFLVVLVAGLGIVAYMLKLGFRDRIGEGKA